MLHFLAFLGFTLLSTLPVLFLRRWKKIEYGAMFGLLAFGMLISIPFLLIEYLEAQLKFYLVILSFIGIEMAILLAESKIRYFHHLIHHNIKSLRIVSFFLIGLGFTYAEIVFTIFHTAGGLAELARILPFKTIYSLLMHTVLVSAASLVGIGGLFAESLYETVFRMLSYYLRISLISFSHYLYALSLSYDFFYLMCAVLLIGMFAFFQLKKALDQQAVRKAMS